MEVIDLKNMSIRDIENKIKHYENEENFYNEMMLNVFERTQPSSVKPKYDIVQGGTTRQEKFLNYVIECEEPLYKEYERLRDEVHSMVKLLTEYVDNELERIDGYEPLMKKIVKLKEEDNKTYEQIAEEVHYCSRQVRRIYKKHKGLRNA